LAEIAPQIYADSFAVGNCAVLPEGLPRFAVVSAQAPANWRMLAGPNGSPGEIADSAGLHAPEQGELLRHRPHRRVRGESVEFEPEAATSALLLSLCFSTAW
jgi:hypothetical protein